LRVSAPGQSVRYALDTVSLKDHLEDAPDHGGGFFVHDKVLFVLRVAAVLLLFLWTFLNFSYRAK